MLWARHTEATASTPTFADVLKSPPDSNIVIEILEPQSTEIVVEDEILDKSELQWTIKTITADEILDTLELQLSIDNMPEMESSYQISYIRSSDACPVEIEKHSDIDTWLHFLLVQGYTTHGASLQPSFSGQVVTFYELPCSYAAFPPSLLYRSPNKHLLSVSQLVRFLRLLPRISSSAHPVHPKPWGD
ncbi:hypothetical protein V6N11_009970 [Hibiscus sabdariffa]|uniref:Uncharacterized protein n=1 Tax=Hibiscus sabdariffa TaxID=183260 RepID=A0ABR2PDA8_9ROSI